MYTIILDQGIVIRDSDQKIISPCESELDPDFLAYQNWVLDGNAPVILNTLG